MAVNEAANPRSALASLAIAGFWILVVLMVFEFPTASPGVARALLLCKLGACTVIFAFVGVRALHRLGAPGQFFVASSATHFCIGMLLAWLQFSSSQWASIQAPAKLKVHSIVTFVAIVVGARVVIDAWGVDKMLRGVLVVLMASSAFVIGLPVWANAGLPLPSGVLFTPTRYFGAFTSPMISGFAGCVVACLGAARLGWHRWGLIGCLAMVLGFASMFLAFSKGAAIGFLALLAFFLLRGPGSRRVLLLAWIAAVATIFFAILAMVDLGGVADFRQIARVSELGQLLTGSFETKATSLRNLLWDIALRKYLESPMIGLGFGEMLEIDDMPVVGIHDTVRAGAHNHYLALGGEAGVIPVLLYLFALMALARPLWTLPRSSGVDVAGGIAVLLALYSFAEGHVDVVSPVIFITGLACALVADASDKQREIVRTPPSRPRPPTRWCGRRDVATGRKA